MWNLGVQESREMMAQLTLRTSEKPCHPTSDRSMLRETTSCQIRRTRTLANPHFSSARVDYHLKVVCNPHQACSQALSSVQSDTRPQPPTGVGFSFVDVTDFRFCLSLLEIFLYIHNGRVVQLYHPDASNFLSHHKIGHRHLTDHTPPPISLRGETSGQYQPNSMQTCNQAGQAIICFDEQDIINRGTISISTPIVSTGISHSCCILGRNTSRLRDSSTSSTSQYHYPCPNQCKRPHASTTSSG